MKCEVPRPGAGCELDAPAAVLDKATVLCEGIDDNRVYPQIGYQDVATTWSKATMCACGPVWRTGCALAPSCWI